MSEVKLDYETNELIEVPSEKEMKKWIDNASYKELLAKWRRAPAGDPFFVNKIGDYYQKAMARRADEMGDAERVRASKMVGW